MAESPTLETREDGAPNTNPRKPLTPENPQLRKKRYRAVDINGAIMPRSAMNSSNEDYGEREAVDRTPEAL
jgi:hypothetical protein